MAVPKSVNESHVRALINALTGFEGPEDGEHSVSPAANAFLRGAFLGSQHIATFAKLDGPLKSLASLRQFRAYLGTVVTCLDECGVEPLWEDE